MVNPFLNDPRILTISRIFRLITSIIAVIIIVLVIQMEIAKRQTKNPQIDKAIASYPANH